MYKVASSIITDKVVSKPWWRKCYLHYFHQNHSCWLTNMSEDLKEYNILIDINEPGGTGFTLTFETEEDAVAFILRWS